MATLTTQAQEVINCDLCVQPTYQFCNRCQLSLCVDCVSKHVDKLKYEPHDIVNFKDRKIRLAFPECEFHSNQRCEAHCQECDVPVCLKCILDPHNGHRYIDLSDIFNKKKDIEKETQEIESIIIPQYSKKNEESENKLSQIKAKLDELEKEQEKHRQIWHQEVDTIFNKLGSMIKSMKENLLAAVKSHQSKIKSQIPDMNQKVQQNKELLKSNKVSAVFNHKSKLEEYRKMPADIDVKLPSLKINAVQGKEELNLELEEYKVSLTQTTLSSLTDEGSHKTLQRLLDQAKSVTFIQTGINSLGPVACVGEDAVWVSGEDKTIRRIDIHGSVRDTVTTRYKTRPNGITVTRQGELVYSDGYNRTVNIVRHRRIETLITTPQGWKPAKLCCTKSGDILVSMYTFGKSQLNKIVRYQGHTVKQEIDRDEDGEPIYKGGKRPLCVVENNNGDICASDNNAKAVVVVDKLGRVRFRYDVAAIM